MNRKKSLNYFFKLAQQAGRTYRVQAGDTLFSIAQRLRVSPASIIEANDSIDRRALTSGRALQAGQIINIPNNQLFTDEEVVAATLLGEGGTTDPDYMPRIMTVILNRANNTGTNIADIALDPDQFSYWNGRQPIQVIRGEMGRRHRLWDEAMRIAEDRVRDQNVGNSTYYYSHRLVEPPFWADPRQNSCWNEIFRDADHVFGTAGRPWDRCNPQTNRRQR